MGAMKAISQLSRYFSSHPLTKDDRLSAWIRFASWQMRSRIRREWEMEWICGQKLLLRRGMTGATGNIYAGLHEFSDMLLAIHLLRTDDVFLDIGANIGSYTILASGVSGATTLAFEPDPDTARTLRSNLTLNKIDGRVTVHECALGDTDGTVFFTRGLDTVNHVVAARDEASREVQVRRLDGLIGSLQPLAAKIDVEGYEEVVLQGASNTLQKENLKAIIIESITPNIEQIFKELDFRRAYYDPLSRKLDCESNGCYSNNRIYIRDWDFVINRLNTAPQVNIFKHSI